jgi:hypothetical protein
MAKTDPASDPSTVSSNYNIMAPRWAMIESLLGGTEAMRQAGEVYLPRHAREGAANYDERRTKSVLYNMFDLTVGLLADKPFTEHVTLSDDMPAALQEYALDIDLKGSDLTRFLHEVFREGLAKGFTHILVDAPASSVPVAERTLADDRQEGIRPYLVHVKPEQVIFAESQRINGEEVYTHVRFRHSEVRRVGYSEVVTQYIRVLDRVTDPDGTVLVYSVWLYQPDAGKDKGKWVPDAKKGGVLLIDRIPLVTFYAAKQDTLLCKPPLMDLAYMNVEHFQSYSDQQNILTVTRFPLLAASGISEYDNNDLVIGPRNLLLAEDPTSRFYYVEHSGAAIAAGEKALADLEDKMAAYGGTLLQKRPDRETAAARSAAEEVFTSPIQRMVYALRDTLAVAFYIMMDMDGEPLGIENLTQGINIKDDFGDDGATAVDLQTLQVAISEGAISRKGFLQALIRMRILPDDFDIEQDQADLMSELDLMTKVALARKGGQNVTTATGGEPGAIEDDEDEDEEEA